MKRCLFVLYFVVFLAGCANHVADSSRDVAWRQIVRSYLHDDEARLSGPVRGPAWPADTQFSPSDELALREFLKSGAVGYLVFVPDYKPIVHNSDGTLVEFIRVARVVVIENDKIAGDYEAL